jgi:predicted dienelactone hydrolase
MVVSAPAAAENRIDIIRPDAPALAAFGPYAIGVTTLDLVNPDQLDIVRVEPGKPHPRYDRRLTVEVWYPAEGTGMGGSYLDVFLRDGETRTVLVGRAIRDAAAKRGPYPLAIISHGYPGNRFLLSPLAENLASKGYVVVAIDHRDSTYNNRDKFGSTLVNRPLDQLFVLDAVERLGRQQGHRLEGVIAAGNAAIIGYSMGGYGAVIASGAGVTEAAAKASWGAPDGTLLRHLAGSPAHRALPDARVKAVVAFAPWGMERGIWNAAGLAGIRTPVFYIAGSRDDVAGYEKGVKAMFEATANADRFLLTYENAGHNAGAPMPAPAEAWAFSPKLGFNMFDHYGDAVWDNVRMNNVAAHFVTAFLGLHLKGEAAMAAYLKLVPNGVDGVWAVNPDKTEKPEHTYWKGFQNRTARGLSLLYRAAGQ